MTKIYTVGFPFTMAEFTELTKDSSLGDLPLVGCQVTPNVLGQRVAELFDADSSLPGVLVLQVGQLIGLVSRRRFHEQVSSPYGREIFFHRPISAFLDVSERKGQADFMVLPATSKIEASVNLGLNRSSEKVYEPIVVTLTVDDNRPQYYLLDFQTLLLAQSQVLAWMNDSLQQQWSQNRRYMLKLDEERHRAKQSAALLEKQQHWIRDRNQILENQQVELVQKNQEIAQLNERFVQISQLLSSEGCKTFEATLAGVDGIYENTTTVMNVGQQLADEVKTVQQVSDMVARVSYQVRHLATKAAIVASHASGELKGFSQIAEEIGTLVNQTYQAGQRLELVVQRFEDRVQNLTATANSGTTIARTLTQETARMQDAIAQLEELIEPANKSRPIEAKPGEAKPGANTAHNFSSHHLSQLQRAKSTAPNSQTEEAKVLLELLNQAEVLLTRIDKQFQGEEIPEGVQQFRQKLAKTRRKRHLKL